MDDLCYRLDRIDIALQHLSSIMENLSKEKKQEDGILRNGQRYYTLREAVRLKTGNDSAYSSFSTNRYLMPAANTNWVTISGSRRWSASIIEEWLNISDEQIPEYCKKYGVELNGKLGKKYMKYLEKDKNDC